MENFPSNSREPKAPNDEKPEKKPNLRVVEGDVVRRKKPLRDRVRETFLGDDSKNVFEYVVTDVLIPAFKDMLNDAVSQGMERMIYGDSKAKRTPLRSAFGNAANRASVNYSRYSSEPKRSDPHRMKSRTSRDFDDIIIKSRHEAETVLERMLENVEKYEIASVRDLYELLGEDFHHTDEKWGWSDLRDAYIRRLPNNGGYLLRLPPTEPID